MTTDRKAPSDEEIEQLTSELFKDHGPLYHSWGELSDLSEITIPAIRAALAKWSQPPAHDAEASKPMLDPERLEQWIDASISKRTKYDADAVERLVEAATTFRNAP